MSFSVDVITMTQEMNLEDGSMAHFLVLRLPTGVLVKALVSDESAQAVVYAKVNGTAPPPPMTSSAPLPPVSNGLHIAEEGEDGVAMVFGEAAPPVPFVPPTPQKNRVVRVERDDWGYPILRTQGGQDPGEVVGGADLDEDGVGQG